MLFAKIENDEIIEWPINSARLCKDRSISAGDNDSLLQAAAELGYVYISNDTLTPPPKQDMNNRLALGPLEKSPEGKWYRTYVLEELTIGSPAYLDRLNFQWGVIRSEREKRFKEYEWRVFRNLREKTLGLQETDNITELEEYRKGLSNITDQEDPFNIKWPIL